MTRPPRPVPQHEAATVAEVKQAIESMSPADALRLRRFAQNRIRKIGPKARGRTYEDLLHEAVIKFLSGDRRWNRYNVDFPGVLAGAIRSISSHWAAQFDSNEVLETDATRVSNDGQLRSPIDNAFSTAPPKDRELAAKEELAKIEKIFLEDDEATLVIESWKGGLNGPKTRASLGLSQTEYDTIVRRIRRKVRARL